ncbi:MAG: 4Fe-4S dicluster domain-containing protein [Dehalococcoidia bacterium]|nr:MAG: 4Fe-4S dicluster domain-containing protein [Dehalococcoidia bacterium]UCG82132.1 MAG: 4Fe-4S dicluster domain-containing protein [Dehalococcoidia bacterium]
MSIKKINIDTLNSWVDGIIEKQKVIGVQARGDRYAFGQLNKAADLRLDYDVAILPPKAFLQPPRETILSFQVGAGYESVVDSEPFVLFGVHPYDLVAMTQMDEIFSQGNNDVHYMTRRQNATVVVMDVQKVSQDVFAGYMGTAYVEDGYDVLLTKIGDEYIVDAKTGKGESLIAALLDKPDAGESWLEQRRLVWDYNRQRLRKHDLKVEPAKWPDILENAQEHPVWEERARLCFSCGSCILLCPTCYCFDVRDDLNWDLSSGERVRVWDGCMLTDFATVAGNLNFRKDRIDRYRHRYYRKGKYVPQKIGGRIACVGCGRCITACVANIANPVEVFNRVAEGK